MLMPPAKQGPHGRQLDAPYPTTPGAFDTSYDNSVGGSEAFITKFNPSGGALSYSAPSWEGRARILAKGSAVTCRSGRHGCDRRRTKWPTEQAIEST